MRGNDSLTQNPLNNSNSVFFDDVESLSLKWVADFPWAITNNEAHSGTQSLTDSPGGDYEKNTNASLLSPMIDLSAVSGRDIYLMYMSKYDIEDFFDRLLIEFTNNNGREWFVPGIQSGFNWNWSLSYFKVPIEFHNSNFQFRFQSDDIVQRDGIYLDDIAVGELPANVDLSSANYEALSGTSMASPHVVGLLALLKAQDPN